MASLRPAKAATRPPRSPSRSHAQPRRLLLRIASLLILAWLLSSARMRSRYAALQSSLIAPELKEAKSILWVTAHPDDESFFFAPTMSYLLGPTTRATGHLLCLSVGDHEGLGNVRRKELKTSCEALGIAAERCVSLDEAELADSPTLWWPEESVQSVVADYVARWNIDLVISFDKYGVSGHANHRAISSHLASSTSSLPPLYELRSTYVLPKYMSLLSLPYAILSHYVSPGESSLFVNGWEGYRQARRSFDAHESQWRWFRTLFVSFSRYLWFGELVKVQS